MCCILPTGEYCRFWANGCTIYEIRPQGCVEFNCDWILGKVDGPRPDEVGELTIDIFTFRRPS